MARWLTVIVTAMAQALGRLRQHHRALGGIENCSTRTARKRHRTLSPHTRPTPTVASSRSAMSAKIRYPIGGNLPACDGIRDMRPRLRQATGLATVLGRYSGMAQHQKCCAVPQLPAKDLHPARALVSPPRLRTSWGAFPAPPARKASTRLAMLWERNWQGPFTCGTLHHGWRKWALERARGMSPKARIGRSGIQVSKRVQ